MIKVNLASGDNRRKMIREVVDQLGSEFIDKCKNARLILIKPDLIHPELQLATVHVDTIRGILDVIRIYSETPVWVADAAHFGTKAAFRNFGYERLIEEYPKVELIDLQDLPTVEQTINLPNETLVVKRPQVLTEADVIISVSNLKTHKDYAANLTVSNLAEGTMIVPPRVTMQGQVWSRAPWFAARGAEITNQIIADLYAYRPAQVGVVDGILGMEGDGPVNGSPVPMGVVLAGADPVAVDAIAATLMGLDPHAVGYLERLAGQGLGVNDMSKIEVPPLLLTEMTRQFKIPVPVVS
jgi:uncharacterized protein (DUF362 family)